MKIELKLNTDTLIAVNNVLVRMYEIQEHPITLTEKIYRSIGLQVAELFEKKTRSRIKKADLFESKKKTKINLHFYEAWGLHQILTHLKTLASEKHASNCIQNVINELNQKLA